MRETRVQRLGFIPLVNYVMIGIVDWFMVLMVTVQPPPPCGFNVIFTVLVFTLVNTTVIGRGRVPF